MKFALNLCFGAMGLAFDLFLGMLKIPFLFFTGKKERGLIGVVLIATVVFGCGGLYKVFNVPMEIQVGDTLLVAGYLIHEGRSRE